MVPTRVIHVQILLIDVSCVSYEILSKDVLLRRLCSRYFYLQVKPAITCKVAVGSFDSFHLLLSFGIEL